MCESKKVANYRRHWVKLTQCELQSGYAQHNKRSWCICPWYWCTWSWCAWFITWSLSNVIGKMQSIDFVSTWPGNITVHNYTLIWEKSKAESKEAVMLYIIHFNLQWYCVSRQSVYKVFHIINRWPLSFDHISISLASYRETCHVCKTWLLTLSFIIHKQLALIAHPMTCTSSFTNTNDMVF